MCKITLILTCCYFLHNFSNILHFFQRSNLLFSPIIVSRWTSLHYKKNYNHQVATPLFSGTGYPNPPHLYPFSFLTALKELFLVLSKFVSSACPLYPIISYSPRTFSFFYMSIMFTISSHLGPVLTL